MDGQYRELIRQKIVDALVALVPPFTRRDVRLPGVANKAVAVIGMRRTGKTTFSVKGKLSRHVKYALQLEYLQKGQTSIYSGLKKLSVT